MKEKTKIEGTILDICKPVATRLAVEAGEIFPTSMNQTMMVDIHMSKLMQNELAHIYREGHPETKDRKVTQGEFESQFCSCAFHIGMVVLHTMDLLDQLGDKNSIRLIDNILTEAKVAAYGLAKQGSNK